MARLQLSAMGNVLAKIQKEYEFAVKDPKVAGIVKRITLDSPQANYAFGGGFPMGRIIELFGPESGGKTTFAEYIGGSIQRQTLFPEQQTVVFMDFERTFDNKYANTVGLDTSDKFVLITPSCAEDGFQYMEDIIKTKECGLIILDSVASMVGRSELTAEYGKQSYGGPIPQILSSSIPRLNQVCADYGTSVIFINQVRAKIGGMVGSYAGADEKTTGGKSLPFYASWRARVSKMDDLTEEGVVIGNNFRVRNIKSKIGFPKRAAELKLHYNSGIDVNEEYFDFFVKLGLIQKSGGWYNGVGKYESIPKLQGESKVMDFLQSHPELLDEMRSEVNKSFNQVTVADKVDLAVSDNLSKLGEDDYDTLMEVPQ